jgi:(1->4)-alpha-D-glucan 1-alpha-D-glucosylmutase
VRMEDPVVFQDTHRLLLLLIREGKIQGLRIDHPDGLRDPAGYFRELRANVPERSYVVIEKILLSDEHLHADWPLAGTTGYDFLNLVNGVFVARHNERFFDTIYFRFLRQGAHSFKDLANSTKKMVMLISLASEVNELAYLLKDIADSDRRYRDFTLNSLTFVIREVIAALDVYRTYIDPTTGAVSDADRRTIERAVLEAKRRNQRTDPSIFDFVGETLLQPSTELRLSFVARFQQTTGPVMAKGVEDTAFYVHNRLLSLNDVGGEPDVFGHSLTTFHRGNLERAQHWPTSMLATSTHDTKRSEDVRARINVLSELPRDWRAALTRWSRLNGRKKLVVEGRAAPDRNEEYLVYQTLLGAWPFSGIDEEFRRRLDEYMLKALREAKVHTSWISINTAYEEAARQFVQSILDTSESKAFLDDFLALQQRVAFFGIFNSLSQTVLKLGAPGVSDTYAGTELWDFSLVDPDNRRPVDFAMREKLLSSLVGEDPHVLLDTREDGRIKLFISHKLLCLRREQPALFVGRHYAPLRAVGRAHTSQHVCAFARVAEGATLVIAAPVLIATLLKGAQVDPVGSDVWRDDWLPVPGEAGRTYRDIFTRRELTSEVIDGRAGLRLREVFGDLPVAALLSS